MHYDHIAFHTEEPDYPGDLPERNAAHHIGFYYAWAVSQNLHSPAAARQAQKPHHYPRHPACRRMAVRNHVGSLKMSRPSSLN